jgi:hypothetical protein
MSLIQAQPQAKKTAGLIEKETNSSPQSSQPPAHRAYGLRPGGRTLRKKTLNNLCVLSGLCGEIPFGMASDFLKFHTRFRYLLTPETWSASGGKP